MNTQGSFLLPKSAPIRATLFSIPPQSYGEEIKFIFCVPLPGAVATLDVNNAASEVLFEYDTLAIKEIRADYFPQVSGG